MLVTHLYYYLFAIVELDKFNKKPEDCITDLDKLIFTMKEAHNIAINTPAPAFLKEPWIASALKELDTRGLSPERRADLNNDDIARLLQLELSLVEEVRSEIQKEKDN
jgi:hypothetical protein